MITQELVAFIKQQLQEGKSKEQIAQLLVPHGWQLEDINEVFTQIMPSAQPVQGALIAQPATPVVEMREPVVVAQPVGGMNQVNQLGNGTVSVSGSLLDSLKNPSALFAGITLVISALASTLVLFYVQSHTGALKTITNLIDQNSIIAGLLAGMMISIIFGGLITKLVTKILKIEPRTFAQAFVFTSLSLVISSVFSVLTITGIPSFIPTIIGIIVWIGLFFWYYRSGLGKAIGAFFLNLIIGGIIAVVAVFGAFSLGVGLVSHLAGGFTKNQTESPMIEVPMVNSSNEAFPETNPLVTPNPDPIIESASTTPDTVMTNPEFAHVKDAFPALFPLPQESEVVTAAVLSATNYEGIRYILDYTSTHSVAYLRNTIKTSLESDGYVVSINEKNSDYRVIVATKVVRNTARSFRIIIEKNPVGVTVHTVFTQ